MHTFKLIVGLATIVSCSSQLASAKDGSSAPYDVDTVFERSLSEVPVNHMTWIGNIEEGGENVTLVGTHHEVAAKIKELNPWWLRNTTHLEKLKREAWARVGELKAAGGEFHTRGDSSEVTKRSNRVSISSSPCRCR